MRYNTILLITLLAGLVPSVLLSQNLKRAVPPKERINELPSYSNGNFLIIKIAENDRTNSSEYFLETDEELFQKMQAVFGATELRIQSLIHQPKEFLLELKRKGEENSGIRLGNLSLYYKIDLRAVALEERISIYNALMNLAELETVYFPVSNESTEITLDLSGTKTPEQFSTPDFSGKQFYLNPAPAGVDAKYAWTKPGGDGTGINFCDIELGLNKTHEDFVQGNLTDISLAPSIQDDHGTAVHGVIYADHNGIGVDGMAYKVKPYFSNAYDSTGQDFDIANAMARAIPVLNPGDVMLLEMMDQSHTTNSQWAPVEFSQAEFDVIQTITASGIIVVEAAGNGNKNLDDTLKYGHKFDSTYRYSGAFMIGGVKSGVSGGTSPARQRLSPSSYGSRVDFYGYSEMVTSLGYGDLYGSTANEKYTAKFSGTSSASPIVTGAAILMESIYKSATGGQTLDHKTLKGLLRYGATPSYAPVTDKVGVMPNLKSAIDHMLLFTGNAQSDMHDASFSVFPTLASDEIFVFNEENTSQQISFSVCDLSGKQILANNPHLFSGRDRIDISGLAPGMYFLKITGNQNPVVVKFVKK